MSTPFTEAEIEQLSQEIDRQLNELKSKIEGSLYRSDTEAEKSLPAKQSQAIVQATGESPKGFLQKFARAARRDLCEEGGVLYKQWQTWGDLDSKDTINTYKAVLFSLGTTGEIIPMLVVALAVITLHLGAKTICKEYGQEEPKDE